MTDHSDTELAMTGQSTSPEITPGTSPAADSGQLMLGLEELIRECGARETVPMATARTEFDEARGQVFADEDLWETRTRSFLQWYALERVAGANEQTPVERRIAERAAISGHETDEIAILEAWRASYRCLAEITEVKPGQISLIDLVGDTHLVVDERREMHGVNVGDIAECRVVAYSGQLHFGGWFLWHPAGTRAPLLDLIKRCEPLGREETLNRAASLLVRSLRYSHVPAEKLYRG